MPCLLLEDRESISQFVSQQDHFLSSQAQACPATGMHKTSEEKNASQFHVSSLKCDQPKCSYFCAHLFLQFCIFTMKRMPMASEIRFTSHCQFELCIFLHLNKFSVIFFPLENLALVGGGFKYMQILIDLNSKYLFRIRNPLDHILHPPSNVV